VHDPCKSLVLLRSNELYEHVQCKALNTLHTKSSHKLLTTRYIHTIFSFVFPLKVFIPYCSSGYVQKNKHQNTNVVVEVIFNFYAALSTSDPGLLAYIRKIYRHNWLMSSRVLRK